MHRFATARNACGVALLALSLAANVCLAGDLVAHNGFEACWSSALSETQFVELQQSTLEVATACVAQSSGSVPGLGTNYQVCDTPACPGENVGCPVTLHSNPFGGDFATGTFAATGSTDSISVHITHSFGTCTINVGSMPLNFSLAYALQADGNGGQHVASLDDALMTVTGAVAYGGTDVICATLAGAYGSAIARAVQRAGSRLLVKLETPATVGESVCQAR
jgi:hypothetical protein